MEVLANAIKEKKYTDWEGKNTSLFTDNMTVYVEGINKSVGCFGLHRYFKNTNSSNPGVQYIFPLCCLQFLSSMS